MITDVRSPSETKPEWGEPSQLEQHLGALQGWPWKTTHTPGKMSPIVHLIDGPLGHLSVKRKSHRQSEKSTKSYKAKPFTWHYFRSLKLWNGSEEVGERTTALAGERGKTNGLRGSSDSLSRSLAHSLHSTISLARSLGMQLTKDSQSVSQSCSNPSLARSEINFTVTHLSPCLLGRGEDGGMAASRLDRQRGIPSINSCFQMPRPQKERRRQENKCP